LLDARASSIASFWVLKELPSIRYEQMGQVVMATQAYETVRVVQDVPSATAQAVSKLLKSLDPNAGHGFSFNASDITAAPIFADR